MNSLSWFIYLIYTLPSVAGLLIFLSIMLGVAYLGIWLYRGIFTSRLDRESAAASEKRINEFIEQELPYVKKGHRKVLIGFLTCSILAALIPERQALVLIASSEVGEKIISSEKVQSVVDPSVELLKEWINAELAKLKEKQKAAPQK